MYTIKDLELFEELIKGLVITSEGFYMNYEKGFIYFPSSKKIGKEIVSGKLFKEIKKSKAEYFNLEEINNIMDIRDIEGLKVEGFKTYICFNNGRKPVSTKLNPLKISHQILIRHLFASLTKKRCEELNIISTPKKIRWANEIKGIFIVEMRNGIDYIGNSFSKDGYLPLYYSKHKINEDGSLVVTFTEGLKLL